MDSMTPQAHEFRNKIADIRSRMQRGDITIEQAKKEAAPVIKEMNAIGERISKEHGMRYKRLTFAYLMR